MAPKDNSTSGTQDGNKIQIIVAVIGLIGTLTVAYLGYRQIMDPLQVSTNATQTAEASPLSVSLENTTIPSESSIPTVQLSGSTPTEGLAVTTPTVSPTDFPTPAIAPTEVSSTTIIYENGEFRNTTLKDFTFRVAKIELNPNGKMRWYFEFWNQTDKGVLFGLNHSNIVLADEFGNQYDVLDASTYPNKIFEETIPVGVLSKYWIDFVSPINNAKKFDATLASANQYWHPNYGLFEINVTYDSSNTPPAPTSTLSTDSSIIFENGDFLNTSFPDFIFRVSRVDLRPNNKMRWYFEFWNQSDKAALFGLNHPTITLADENGNQYTVLDSSTYPNKLFEQSIPAGVLLKLWIEFDSPVNNAKIFKVTLAPANYYWHPRYDVFTINFK